MAVTVERKLEVARRSYQILTEEMGVAPEDIWWDPLVFPCGTGDEAYLGSAAQTIEGVRAVKAEFPLTQDDPRRLQRQLRPARRRPRGAQLGLSLSLRPSAGLDAAIVNTEQLARYAEIPAEERRLAEALIYPPARRQGGGRDGGRRLRRPLPRTQRAAASATARARAALPLEERLARAIVEGSKDGLEADLETALGEARWPRRWRSSTAR